MILAGDCIEQMRTLEADSVDAIVTDPPYGLEFMGKDWDGFGTPLGFQTWTEQWGREALRVLKPGGHLIAFGGTRMYHRLAAGNRRWLAGIFLSSDRRSIFFIQAPRAPRRRCANQ